MSMSRKPSLPFESPTETMLAALQTMLVSGVLIDRGPLWKIVDNAIVVGAAAVPEPIAPALAAQWLAEKNIHLDEVTADHRLIGTLVWVLMANGADHTRLPRNLVAVRDELAALTQESLL
ncbi:hypothetical protein [uncultured Methylobacterium sp.]|uniref:hypothetical protein n=1 Tax=uncultured Methylobacterium sp. TaxID=157278 RepID=UPI0035CA7A51